MENRIFLKHLLHAFFFCLVVCCFVTIFLANTQIYAIFSSNSLSLLFRSCVFFCWNAHFFVTVLATTSDISVKLLLLIIFCVYNVYKDIFRARVIEMERMREKQVEEKKS